MKKIFAPILAASFMLSGATAFAAPIMPEAATYIEKEVNSSSGPATNDTQTGTKEDVTTAVNNTDGGNIYGFLSWSGDKDVYKMTFNVSGTVNFFLDAPNNASGAPMDYRFKVIDSANAMNNKDGAVNAGGDSLLSNYPIVPGRVYYVQVYSASGTQASTQAGYMLRVKNYPL